MSVSTSSGYLPLADDDAFLNADKVKDLGDIRLTIELVTCDGLVVRPRIQMDDTDEKVHERSKKGMVHRVK